LRRGVTSFGIEGETGLEEEKKRWIQRGAGGGQKLGLLHAPTLTYRRREEGGDGGSKTSKNRRGKKVRHELKRLRGERTMRAIPSGGARGGPDMGRSCS